MSDDFGLLTDNEHAFVHAYTEKIRREERDRIVTLLETLIGDSEAAIYVDEFIALIKGDTE